MIARPDPSQVFLFDMDGVIVDVSSSYRWSIRQTCYLYFEGVLGRKLTGNFFWDKKIGFLKKQGNFNNDWDLSFSLLTDLIKRGKGKEQPDYRLMKEMFQEIYLGEHFEKFYHRKRRYWFKPGLYNNERLFIPKNIFSKLALRGELGVVTGRPLGDAKLALEKFGLKNFFKMLVTEDDLPGIKQRKPSPYPLLKAIRALKAQKKEIFYFGDNIDDMKMACAVRKKIFSLRAVGCLWNKDFTGAVLRQAGADLLIKKPADILKAINSV
ncbi:MAG: HAD hydrolase-like protein [Elusimicrobiota bacterium]